VETVEAGLLISGGRTRSVEHLLEAANRAATGFREIGVAEDDCVAIMLRNDFPFFEASLGAAAAGANPVPINWHGVAIELRYQLETVRAKALVIHADLLAAVRDGVPAGTRILVVDTPPEIAEAYRVPSSLCRAPAGETAWEPWLGSHAPLQEASKAVRTSVIFTSGTTGNPKAVVRAPAAGEAAAALADMGRTIFGMRPGEAFRTVLTGPLYHSAPNFFGLTAIRTGGLVVMQPKFEAEELLALVERHRITHLHLVPIMFSRLLALPEATRSRYDLSSLVYAVHAAAPCPAAIKRRMIDWWGPIIHEYYGGTETGAATFMDSADALRKPGSVGRTWERGRVEVRDPDGKLLPAGETGLIYLGIRGFPDFTYMGRPEERKAIERAGLVTCGDVGWLDEEGFLFLCDRAKDMVISGGVNIYPAEIEAVLATMPGLRDCAVFGIPDDEFGESLCAHVELQPGSTVSTGDIHDHLRGRIANYKIPKTIVLVDGLPREDSGKIFKRKLRDPYWAGSGRRI
jgi:long-chain acyl-CoA synthetase